MQKPALIAHLNAMLALRASDLAKEIAATLEARNSDTKSSAGDKHEVGRAMVQQELDQLEMQLAKTRGLMQELERVPAERAFDRVGFGSLVSTDQGLFFIAIGMGAVELVQDGSDAERCYVISLASPIGQALKSLKTGEQVSVNGKTFTILSVE